MKDLNRAGLFSQWWLINSSLYANESTNDVILSKANLEAEWINHVHEISEGKTALIKWISDDVSHHVLDEL